MVKPSPGKWCSGGSLTPGSEVNVPYFTCPYNMSGPVEILPIGIYFASAFQRISYCLLSLLLRAPKRTSASKLKLQIPGNKRINLETSNEFQNSHSDIPSPIRAHQPNTPIHPVFTRQPASQSASQPTNRNKKKILLNIWTTAVRTRPINNNPTQTQAVSKAKKKRKN